jgi:hypothetical protein
LGQAFANTPQQAPIALRLPAGYHALSLPETYTRHLIFNLAFAFHSAIFQGKRNGPKYNLTIAVFINYQNTKIEAMDFSWLNFFSRTEWIFSKLLAYLHLQTNCKSRH